MAGIKNYIHYHNNMGVLNKITDESLKEMIKLAIMNGIMKIFMKIAVRLICRAVG